MEGFVDATGYRGARDQNREASFANREDGTRRAVDEQSIERDYLGEGIRIKEALEGDLKTQGREPIGIESELWGIRKDETRSYDEIQYRGLE